MTDSWVEIPAGSDFPLHNLPYGVFSMPDGTDPSRRRIGVAIGPHVLDLAALSAAGTALPAAAEFGTGSLNGFMARGRPVWTAARKRLTEVLSDRSYETAVRTHLIPLEQVRLHLPFEVGDYVDFYSSRDHAENVGKLFRPDSPALPASWLHLPIGYHGRAGTVVVSGTPIVRPSGQRRPPGAAEPVFGPSTRLDIEAEIGFVVGAGSSLGTPVPAAAFDEHVFGVVLLNDWSARDIQAWEYQPLGPFLGKSFATSISPWVVPLDALRAARVAPPPPELPQQPYLHEAVATGLDLALEIEWNGTVVSRPPFRSMYWTPGQQLAHLTINGASIRTGDLYASGTVSGLKPDQRGSFLELSWNGSQPVTLGDGRTRTFLEDGDTVTIRARAPGENGNALGFGEVAGTIVAAVR
ncbi:MAG TPA: fumarylacetoacetase [Actinomycetes bacterium]|nr:fumarylacetoacetase [Actinomycetes bacterium]